jgi:predicted ATPase
MMPYAHCHEAEFHQLKRELLLARGDGEAAAEACYRKAIEVARRQQARSWELRAVMSLCRLWQWQGKREKARQILAEIYGWFTEGFDTPDLQEAKALLEELAVKRAA